MPDRCRVGVLGLSHDHVWDSLKVLAESGMGELAAASDPRPELREKASRFGAQRVFQDHMQLLDCDDLNAVYVYSDNRESAELAVAAAARGLHAMVEKPMAADLTRAALVCHLPGLPSRVTAVRGRLAREDMTAEDNAALIMENEGAISTATASWTQSGHLTSYVPMIYGTLATLVVQSDELILSSERYPEGVRVDLESPDPKLRSSATWFLDHIRTGQPITGLCSPSVGVATQEVLEAGFVASRTGCAVTLPLAR